MGQYVTAGSAVGVIYDSAAAEIRLPLNREQLTLASFTPGAVIAPDSRPSVVLYSNNGGKWPAKLTRMDASIDRETRFYHVIAEVEQPFDLQRHPQPLVMGLFVTAEIEGKTFDHLLHLPKQALLNQQVFTVGKNDQLVPRQVAIIDREDDSVWVKSSIKDGELIVISDPRVLGDGMKVRYATITTLNR